MTVVVITCLTIILYVACKISCNQFLHITATASNNLDPLCFKNVLCTLSHIAGKHYSHSHLFQNRCDSALASASFG